MITVSSVAFFSGFLFRMMALTRLSSIAVSGFSLTLLSGISTCLTILLFKLFLLEPQNINSGVS